MALFAARKKCYCAFCKSERVVYTKRRIDVFNVMAAILASGLTMMAIWQGFDPRVMLFFVGYIALAETFVQIRWRLNIICKNCGFDPVLYVKDSAKAADKVKLTLEKRKNDPTSILKAPLNIPFLTKKKQTERALAEASAIAAKKGGLVSKQI